MKKSSHKQDEAFAFIGILGGLICSIADYFLEYIGKISNETLGKYGVIESAWEKLSDWRFPASIWLAAVAVPMYVMGFIAIIRQMKSTNEKIGRFFGISALLGSLGALFIHIVLCILPVAYKYTLQNASQEVAVGVVDKMTESFIVPFYTYYVFLIIIPLVLWIVYCFTKKSLYCPAVAIVVVGFTIVCILLGSLVPKLEFMKVGCVSRLIAMWSFTSWIAERKKDS